MRLRVHCNNQWTDWSDYPGQFVLFFRYTEVLADRKMPIFALAREEYEMQLFGFTQSSVVAAVKGIMLDTLELVLESISGKLTQRYRAEDVSDFSSALNTAYRISIEDHSADLEAIVAESFTIDQTIYLPEDEIQATRFEENDEVELDRKLEAAQRKLDALRMMEKKLHHLVGKIFLPSETSAELLALSRRSSALEENYSALMGAVEDDFPASLISALASSLSLD